jgi:hypothetical protein
VTAFDDYEPRTCECGHREHKGLCNASYWAFYPMNVTPPPGLPVTIVRPNKVDLQRVDLRCTCTHFYEYEGEQP